MARRAEVEPPRPLHAGDVVAAPSEALGAWTACQVTRIDTAARKVAVLPLDWVGPEPSSLSDLPADLAALRLTMHSYTGDVSVSWVDWLLPRSHRVIGTRAPVLDVPCRSYAGGWPGGNLIAEQRAWDRGERDREWDPHGVRVTSAAALRELVDTPRPGVLHLTTLDAGDADVDALVTAYPQLTSLGITSGLGLLHHAERLGDLTGLRTLWLDGVFGMEAAAAPTPAQLPHLERLHLVDVPAAYARRMTSLWAGERGSGVDVDVRRGRSDAWVEQNRFNPLRAWDGDDRIGAARYQRLVTLVKATRREVLALAGEAGGAVAWRSVGERYAAALNALDRRRPFIETVEREHLMDVLAELVPDDDLDAAARRAWLWEGVDAVRDW